MFYRHHMTIVEKKNLHTDTRWLCTTPDAVILAIPPGRAHEDVRSVAEEGDGGEVGESPVLSPPLGWNAWIATKNGCRDEEKRGKTR